MTQPITYCNGEPILAPLPEREFHVFHYPSYSIVWVVEVRDLSFSCRDERSHHHTRDGDCMLPEHDPATCRSKEHLHTRDGKCISALLSMCPGGKSWLEGYLKIEVSKRKGFECCVGAVFRHRNEASPQRRDWAPWVDDRHLSCPIHGGAQ